MAATTKNLIRRGQEVARRVEESRHLSLELAERKGHEEEALLRTRQAGHSLELFAQLRSSRQQRGRTVPRLHTSVS